MKLLFRTLWMFALGLSFILAPTDTLYAAEISKQNLAKYGQQGGPFTLIDQRGKTVQNTDFLGKYMFVFFGYTSCPDVCPTAMQTVSDSLDIMGDLGKDIQPIFISVDPERDKPKILADFISNFSPRIIALTGDKKAIDEVTKAYGVRFEKVLESVSPSNTDQSYLINHFAGTFLMDRKGRFLVLFPSGISPADMAKNLVNIVKKH
ncbi:MAG: SCO family protein [Magnetovibrio sp.]|nr:SCO family protein [Magnetovibrio sp.]